METIPIPVRTALMPLCFKDFHCLATACRDNCCGGWEIAFNKKDYLKIKRTAQSEELKEILSKGMSRLRNKAFDNCYAHFNVGAEGICAFQTEEGLCLLQMECGAEVLPEVCRQYPRKSIYTTVAREFSLSPSCEGVLALLWDLPQGIDFLEEDLPKQQWRNLQVPPRYVRFGDIRSFCIDVLQERTLSLPRRIQLLGLLLQQLRDQDWTAEGVVDQWLAEGERALKDPSIAAVLEELPRNRLACLTDCLRILLNQYQDSPAGRPLYRTLFTAASADGEDWEKKPFGDFSLDDNRYQALEEKLEALLGHSDVFFENLMVMSAFYVQFPDPMAPEDLWRSYVRLCLLYGFYRFSAVCGCAQEVSRERLFQVIGTVSRGLLHNDTRMKELADNMIAEDGSMARMAVLVRG